MFSNWRNLPITAGNEQVTTNADLSDDIIHSSGIQLKQTKFGDT